MVQRLDQKDKLHYIAEAGLRKAIARLRLEPARSYHALKDTWNSNPAVFGETKIGDGTFNVCYNYLDNASGAFFLVYGMVDEERKININEADLAVLKRLFQVILGEENAVAEELSAAIVDWRDSDSNLSLPLGSAEDSYYRGQLYAYEAKDAKFEVLEEVLLVKEMHQQIFEKVKDYLTVYGNGKVNVNTCSKVVLLALGLPADLADKLIAFRAGNDGVEATDDDNIFTTPAEVVTKLSQAFRFNEADIRELSNLAAEYFVTTSTNFMARSVARLENHRISLEATAVFDQKGRIFSWRES